MATLNRTLFRLSATKPRISTTPIRSFSSSIQRHQTIPFQVQGQGEGVAQAIKVSGSSHQINTDAYPAFGGKDEYPSPLHFNLTALSSCTQVTGSIVAKDHGIKLGKWDVGVEGHLDPKVLVGGEQGNGNWSSIALTVNLESDADQAKFDKLASEIERRCPVTQLFKQSGAEWKSKWTNKSI